MSVANFSLERSLLWAALVAVPVAVLSVGCSARRSIADINAMSDGELRAHWDEVQYAMPDVGTGYRQTVRSAGVNRFGRAWSEEHQAWVLQRMIWEGMTAEQLYWSWGKPEQRFTDQYPPFKYEHWYWGVSPYSTGSEVTLQDGQVIWYRIGDLER